MWLPSSGWNGKFQAVGNGGWAGTISYPALAQAVARGYASASTDTGHTGNSAAFALGHPEKVVDIGYRAVHEMTVQAKAIIDAFYGSAPKVSFWNGCSLGGRQGITEAQRYPADFDAIVAGAPAVNNIFLHGSRMMINRTVHRSEDSYIPPAKYPAIRTAVLESCDALDGVKDGVIENPTRCRFDPKVLECKGADGPSCLTPAQVETAKALYAPVRNPATGAEIFPALLMPGSESDWRVLAGPEPIGTAYEAFKFVVFQDPNWDWHRFNPATDTELALKKDNGVLHSGNPDLKAFFNRGGKLLMYHGWSDPQVAPLNSVNYFNNVTRTVGKNVDREVAAVVHGPRHGPLRRRARHRHVRQDGRHRAMGRNRASAREHQRIPLDRGNRRSHAAALSLREGGEVEGHRQHRRCRELQLCRGLNRKPTRKNATTKSRRHEQEVCLRSCFRVFVARKHPSEQRRCGWSTSTGDHRESYSHP